MLLDSMVRSVYLTMQILFDKAYASIPKIEFYQEEQTLITKNWLCSQYKIKVSPFGNSFWDGFHNHAQIPKHPL